ncbi:MULTISPECIES: lysophospholipid acyltransferase family protein [Thermodesulfovibrio]|jgi:KDO2-lipid IV(A) lauroyltransferase|uniref:Lipid A lauroyl acyltransferase, putative n=2 Tax=Thermodesulfovibrio yellowstonii TaxID=28262 RepID=B5YJ06_THEYD|nr:MULTISPECIES: lysophospholipid acyltransferase family protein [Thermodesulfovibrio]ACI20698.1 lipid A lauroyl acyltransferase, putative [Thermodesulfovibrio yellowstonii DSM 11347]MDI6865371.1 lysophospholipid acyltransferase family protein [Thermodesulfovibrio yellowstonii]GLI52523.1 lipid A lauroyl acyltransferase [Thermodesulfovibrio islandicus]
MKSFVKHIIFKFALKFFMGLGRILGKKQLITVSSFLGSLLYSLSWKRKNVAFDNLKIAFEQQYKESELKKVLKKFIQEIILTALEIAFIVKKKEKLAQWAKVSGIEHLDEALKKRKGIIALSAHLGNIPVMLAWLAEKGYPVAVLFKEGKYLPEGFLYNLIKSYKIYPIPFRSDREVPKEIISALNKNMIVFILADQARPGIYAKFFGKYVQCQKGAFVIAQRKGSPLVPIFIVRGENGHEIKIYPEIELQKQVEILIEKYNCLLEELIRKYPEQYYWFHRRFKRMRVH